MSRAHLVFATLVLMAAGLLFAAAAPVRADLIGDALSVFQQEEDPSQDPYIPVHDAFLSKAQAMEAAGNLPKALEYYKIAASATPSIRETARQAIALKNRLDSMAQDLFKSAKDRFDAGDKTASRELLLKALRYDPELSDAVDYLRDKFGEQVYDIYTVAKGDTLESIARKVYDNPGAEFLITKINNISLATTLSPGDTLRLPKVAAELSKPIKIDLALAQPAPKAAAPAKGGSAAPEPTAMVPSGEAAPAGTPAEDTAALVSMAKMQFNQRLYDTVVSLTDEILAYEPDNLDAKNMRRESYYQLANQYISQDNDLQAVKLLLRIPTSYKDTAALIGTLKGKLEEASEPHYLAGVNYFINENLEKAVEEWETTLQINPFHTKAKSDLEKAKQLLETVRKLD